MSHIPVSILASIHVSPFLFTVASFCLACMGVVSAMCLFRVFIGPKAADRAVSFDSLAMNFMGIVVALSIIFGQDLYFDAVWILTLVGFVGTVAIAKYIEKGRVF